MKQSDFWSTVMWSWSCEICSFINSSLTDPKNKHHVICGNCKKVFEIEKPSYRDNISDDLYKRIDLIQKKSNPEVFNKWAEGINNIDILKEALDLIQKGVEFIIYPNDETGDLKWSVGYEDFWLDSFNTREQAITFAKGMNIKYIVNERKDWLNMKEMEVKLC